MDDITQLILTSGLVFLLGFFVLVFPLLFMLAGNLQPWLAKMAAEREASSRLRGFTSSAAPPARRRMAAPKKAAVSRSSSSRAPARKTPKKTTTTKKSARSKAAAPKKKAPAKKKAATRKAPAGAKVDPKLGVIYSKKPAETDDLKKISGVAKVLEGKLHKQGIYTYRQVADWNAAQMEAFGERLSFKGRIQRDNWKKQARALHKTKYGKAL